MAACACFPVAAATASHRTADSDPSLARRVAGWKTRTYAPNPAGTTEPTDRPITSNPSASHSAATVSSAISNCALGIRSDYDEIGLRRSAHAARMPGDERIADDLLAAKPTRRATVSR